MVVIGQDKWDKLRNDSTVFNPSYDQKVVRLVSVTNLTQWCPL